MELPTQDERYTRGFWRLVAFIFTTHLCPSLVLTLTSFSTLLFNKLPFAATNFTPPAILSDVTFSDVKRFEWVRMNLDTGAAVNTFPTVLRSRRKQELEGTIEQPVARAFPMVDFRNLMVMMKTVCSDL